MKFRTFAIGYILVLAVYLFAKSHVNPPQPGNHFSKVVDLTRPELKIHDSSATVLDVPSDNVRGLSKANQIPAGSWTAPLVVLDVESEMKSDPRHQISVEDIADWELAHGEIPPEAVVIARTGFDANAAKNAAGYSMDAAHFLVEGREVIAIGADTSVVNGQGTEDVDRYVSAHSVYRLENVANLEMVPLSGSAISVTLQAKPSKKAPVLLLARVQ
jgi:kynurenine formamidase